MNNNRIIGVLAHVDAGKTTLSEAMLYLSGTLRKAGRVDHGDTFLDTNDIERDRGITIFSSQARMKLGDLDVILLDTPGHVDFSAETERTLQVLDYAVLVISGTDGVQSHTRTLWRLLELYRIPVFLFVNKMDLPGAEASSILHGLQRELSPDCVDFTMAVSGECSPSDRSDFEEALAMCSDALLDEYMQEGSLSPSSVTKAIARRWFAPEDAAKITSDDLFFRVWTRREALTKALGGTVYDPDLPEVLTGEAVIGGRRYIINDIRLPEIPEIYASLCIHDSAAASELSFVRL